MKTRREFLVMAAGAGVALKLWAPVFASGTSGSLSISTSIAVTQVFGDGIRLTDIAVQYSQPVDGRKLNLADFTVEGRTVTDVFTSRSANPADKGTAGEYVIIALSPKDKNAVLAEKLTAKKTDKTHKPTQGGPGNAGDVPTYDTVYPTAKASFEQVGSLYGVSGSTLSPEKTLRMTHSVNNLIVDDFRQFEFHDPKTGRSLKYNLFIPAGYSKERAWPMVIFMHDAGATSDVTRTTLYQGLGAICWASPEDQAQRPCFVLAPQYEEIIADDKSHTSAMLDTTVNLIQHLAEQYHLDRSRLYTTGQSGGCMMSIAMDIKYPDLFAASFLVAGQWDPLLVKPLARQKLWIIVSQDDDKAWPGQNAIVDVLEHEGANVTRAEWDGTWDARQFRQAFGLVEEKNSPINYITFRKGTVVPDGESMAGASGHRNTWRIAYTIEPVREWIFRQHK
ncbi:carboxylesterase family protein [Serratia ficaria]|uniref:carboxylesterase family protein n=1 Tax=Serratia ficaria TaxID=61651 RepID=UPI00119C0657|nr:PHB depolymerase family esterase [Serratia ficaria]CAI0746364.1 Poly(3-hydroxybutyrate) depolymerase [Serratia ficaria]CAI1613053.1 Poly(3-hydroxybutyrate) depolymerase [Serratia ficaria]CAI2496294.1 Poly(3-hydroxybutyrate) depolymerase [Serratia ficaria]VVA50887.1 Esterase PHB depolymerase [Serratia ficaria]